MTRQTELLFSFLKKAIHQNATLPESLSEEDAAFLDALSKAHDLSHLVGFAMAENKVLPKGKTGERLAKAHLSAIYRFERQNYEFLRIQSVLEEGKIPHIPLKGAVLRSLYPQAWMRTGCDLDILVHPEDLDTAKTLLVEKLGFQADERKNFHDLPLTSPGGIFLELHFSLLEGVESLDKVLSRAWDYANPAENGFVYLFENEFFFFHQIAHAAYHFLSGGCGIRPFLDLFFLQEKTPPDPSRLFPLLEEADLLLFYENAMRLSRVWFGEEKHTQTTLKMEEYLLGGGVFGTVENKVAMESAEKGKGKRLWERIFMPYEKLKTYYTVLERHPVLTPFYQVARWFRILFGKERRRAAAEWKETLSLSREKEESLRTLREDLGLSEM